MLTLRAIRVATITRAAALAQMETYSIRGVETVERRGGIRSFKTQDLSKHWSDITSAGQRHYAELFARGDLGARAS